VRAEEEVQKVEEKRKRGQNPADRRGPLQRHYFPGKGRKMGWGKQAKKIEAPRGTCKIYRSYSNAEGCEKNVCCLWWDRTI